jgi:hypothetical protein
LDADLSATADADGKLEPLERAAVALVLFENGAPVSRPPMSNFVVSRPQVVDEPTGLIAEFDRIRQARLLPEDVIFEASGKKLAVAVFHRGQGVDRQRGFIDFFAIVDGALKTEGAVQAITRGAHDLGLPLLSEPRGTAQNRFSNHMTS